MDTSLPSEMSSLLEDIYFEELLDKLGRVQCLEIGHELLAAEEGYGMPQVHFKELVEKPSKVQCMETGHELLAVEKQGYGCSKKCRRAFFDLCLAQQKVPLNIFEQSPTSKDKVACKLTGDLLNKSKDAIWKHINDKKFLGKLAQKEDEKKAHIQQGVYDFMDVSLQPGDTEHLGSKTKKGSHVCCEGDNDENMDREEPTF
ncbi:hypothetical protein L7F22_045328 [Adiantum nelumboides]|nr:hypothetical protein [Adiantum nelumboides]